MARKPSEKTEILVERGFKELDGFKDEFSKMRITGSDQMTRILNENEAMFTHLVCFMLSMVRFHHPKVPFVYVYVTGIADMTFAMDEHKQFWIAPGRVDLYRDGFMLSTNLVKLAPFD